jgi:aspartate-semialdehyde dehydrogenase
MKRYRTGILGATGLVGQRLIQRLESHAWFELTALAASERSVGRSYAEAARWVLPGRVPPGVAAMEVRAARPDALADCDLVLSALDAPVARTVEPAFAEAGFAVVSNSSAFRQDAGVPLLVPEINADHVALAERQRHGRGGGFIVTNPNCSVTGLALAVAPLHRAFGLKRLVVATLQAASGAGIDGPRALELTDNVIPHIAGEEEKIELELGKILGTLEPGGVRHATIAVSAHCHRVPVIDGHLESVSLELERPASVGEVRAVLERFTGEGIRALGLPSAAPPILVRDEPDRPQPRLDRDTGGGMTVVIGRVRPCSVLGIKLELLSHNAVRGAAGATLLNAELLAARELLPRRAAG